jgi:sec-independent protein translocase protein TatB
MLTDLSPAHIIILIVVALIVVGPKDLPRMLRRAGQFMGRMRGMANEFRSSFDEMARQSELDDLRKEVEAMRKASQSAIPQDLGIDAAMRSDAEAAYLANWEASHAPSADSFLGRPDPEPSILPPPAEPAPASGEPKARPPRKKAAKAPADEAAPEAPPKPRAKKAKPEGGA